jgi:hypothetical protein
MADSVSALEPVEVVLLTDLSGIPEVFDDLE